MMSKILLLVSLVLYCTLCKSDELLWLDHEDRGPGSALYENIQMVKVELPEYQHRTLIVTPQRNLQMVEERRNFVYSAGLQGASQRLPVYETVPYYIDPGRYAIAKAKSKDRLKPFVENGSLDLEKLLNESDLRLIVADKLSYGKYINELLRKNEANLNIIKRNGAESFSGTYRMLAADRGEVSIGYMQEFNDTVRKNGLQGDEFIFYKIKNEPPLIYTCFWAPRTEWGQSIVNKLNDVLIRLRKTKAYRNSIINKAPEDVRPELIKAMNESFGNSVQ